RSRVRSSPSATSVNVTSVEFVSVARSPGGYTQRYEKRCGRSAVTTVMPTTLGASLSARNVSDPTAPGRASTSATSANHVRIRSGDRAPHHLDGRVDLDLTFDRVVAHRTSLLRGRVRRRPAVLAASRRRTRRVVRGGGVGIKPTGRGAGSAGPRRSRGTGAGSA